MPLTCQALDDRLNPGFDLLTLKQQFLISPFLSSGCLLKSFFSRKNQDRATASMVSYTKGSVFSAVVSVQKEVHGGQLSHFSKASHDS